ncbi:MAG TPA: hypothetical protein P5308_07420 [Syntrophales bacterium]|nr:hypothetical protein [Syntrophales bacterium]HRT71172.1 hypothetical protein [Syntrophales bacterium]
MVRTGEEVHPCVGCGFCCIRQTCTFGCQRHPESLGKVCPELEWNGNRYVCRLLKTPGPMVFFYKEELQVGGGCRSYLNPWRKDIRPRTKEDLTDL